MDALTAQFGSSFDRLRKAMQVQGNLILQSAATNSYLTLATVDRWWYPEAINEVEIGEQFIEVHIAEYEGLDVTAVGRCTAVIMEGRRHKGAVERRPLGSPRVWLLKVSPNGETVV